MSRVCFPIVAVLALVSVLSYVSAETGLEGEGEAQDIDFGSSSPLIVQILGRSPNLLIRSRVNTSSFIKLRFGELLEVDPTAGAAGPGLGGPGQGGPNGPKPKGRGGPKGGDSGVDMEVEYDKTNVEGKGVRGRRVPALVQNSYQYENGTINVNGVPVRFIRLTTLVRNITGIDTNYTRACQGTGFLGYTEVPDDSYIRITVFVTQQNTSFPYGDTTIDVPANSVKFNVEVNKWPFCKASNYLVLGIETKTNSATPPPVAIFNETQYSTDFRRGRGKPPGAPNPNPTGFRGARIRMDPKLDMNMDLPQYGYDHNNTDFNGTHWNARWNTTSRSFRMDTDTVDQDNKKILRFFFPGNVTYMFYDPVMTVEAAAADTPSPPPPPSPPPNAGPAGAMPTLAGLVLAAWLAHLLAAPISWVV